MSEDYTEEFVVEEEEGPNRRFLIIAGSLIGLFIIIAACTLGYFIIQGGGDGDDEVTDEAVAIRLTENAQTNAENTRVVQTIEALTREAAAAPEDTPTPRPTLAPTNTPVSEVEAAPPSATSPADATADAEGTATSEAEAAPPGEGTEQDTPTPTLAPVTPAAPTGGDELPQTGFETVSLVAAALVLVSLLLIARRLRSN
jgi:LPXTG-motif cell wall-anchored protein